MILILTDPQDAHADAVEPLLAARGADVVRFDPAELPDGGTTALSVATGDRPARTLVRGGQVVDLDAVTAVWWRRPGFPQEPARLAGTPAGAAARDETRGVVHDLLDTLDGPGVLLLPAARPVADRAQNKQQQLRAAARLGLEVPPTLVTSDPDAVLAFAARHERIVSKRATPGLALPAPPRRAGEQPEVGRYTDPVLPFDLLHVDAVRLCPMVFQAYVPKRLELRVTIVGRQVYAAAIASQGTHRTRDDWRHYDARRTRVTPYDLPDDVADLCLALLDAFGLRFGTFDLVLTPDGRHVFLELNPNGQFLWIEELTGLPLAAAVADLLVRGAQAADGTGARRLTEVPA